jgi:hypothetical protein
MSIGLMLHKCTYKSQAVNVSQLFRPLLLLVTFLSICVLNKHVEGKTIHAHCQGIGEIYHKQFWNDFPFPPRNVCMCVFITLGKASITTTITNMTVVPKSPVGYTSALRQQQKLHRKKYRLTGSFLLDNLLRNLLCVRSVWWRFCLRPNTPLVYYYCYYYYRHNHYHCYPHHLP